MQVSLEICLFAFTEETVMGWCPCFPQARRQDARLGGTFIFLGGFHSHNETILNEVTSMIELGTGQKAASECVDSNLNTSDWPLCCRNEQTCL